MVFSKSNTVIRKRRHHKKKKNFSNELKPIINPCSYDGSSNWLQLQKVCNMSDKNKNNVSTEQTKDVGSSIANRTDEKLSQRKDFRRDEVKSKITNTSPGKVLNDSKLKLKSSPYKKKPVSLAKSSEAFSKVSEDHKITNASAGKMLNDSTLKSKALYKKKPVSLAKSSAAFSKVSEDQKNDSAQFSFNFTQKNADLKKEGQVLENSKFTNNIRLTKAVAMDCEMVGTGPSGEDSIVARVSIVNSLGECIYDEFVKPKEEIADYRTRISGVRPSDFNNAKELHEVQKEVCSIIENRILVGHSLQNDLRVLYLHHPRWKIRDTATYQPFRALNKGRTPSLKLLTSYFLDCEIQDGEHNSVEDAQAAMLLYLRHKKEWEHHLKHKKRKHKAAANGGNAL